MTCPPPSRVPQVLDFEDHNMGYDAATNQYTDMIKAGIIDPLKVCARLSAVRRLLFHGRFRCGHDTEVSKGHGRHIGPLTEGQCFQMHGLVHPEYRRLHMRSAAPS